MSTHRCPHCDALNYPNGITVGDQVVYWDGGSVYFTESELAIFEALMAARGRVLSRPYIHDGLYGFRQEDPGEKIVDVFLVKIRKKLREANAPFIIKTVWGQGYKLGRVNEPAKPRVLETAEDDARKVSAVG